MLAPHLCHLASQTSRSSIVMAIYMCVCVNVKFICDIKYMLYIIYSDVCSDIVHDIYDMYKLYISIVLS